MDYYKKHGGFGTNIPEDNIPMISKDGGDNHSEKMSKTEGVDILAAAYDSDIENLRKLISEDVGRVSKAYEPTNDTLLHRIAAGGATDCVKAAEFILDNDKWKSRIDINAMNVKGNTALHNCVMDHDRLDLVNLFVKHGANVTIKNNNMETPLQLVARFNSTRATEIAGIFLSHYQDLGSEGEKAFYIATKNYSVNMLKYLWNKCQKHESLFKQNNKEYGTLLHTAVREGRGSEEAVKTVKFLLGILPAEKVNELNGDGNAALHSVATYSCLNLFSALVVNPKVNVFMQNHQKQSCLDVLAQASGHDPNAVSCAQILFKKSKTYEQKEEAMKRLLIFKAIKIAVRHKSTVMTQVLVQEHGNCGNAIASEEGLLESIYRNTPLAAIPMLDKAVTYERSKDEDDLEKVNVDMGPIVGFKWDGEPLHESEALFGIFKSNSKQQRKILDHPVVKIFLREKWNRLKGFTFFYIFLYFAWLLAYSTFVYEIYSPECPSEEINSTGSRTNKAKTFTNSKVPKLIMSLTLQNTTDSGQNCEYNAATVQILAGVLYIFTFFFICQEFVKIALAKWNWRNYLSVITILQIIRHVAVAINISSAFKDVQDIPNFQYHLGVFLFAYSWLLFLRELAYIPKLALWLSILMKTAWKYGKFMLYFVPILIGFVPILRKYVRKYKQFTFLPFGVIKNVILMTGELDYRETFYEEEGASLDSYDIVGQFILVIAVFGFGLVLANVLTGAAVKNFQDLYRDAEYETSLMQLKSIYFFDSLMSWLQQWPYVDKFSRCFDIFHLKYEEGESRTVRDISTQGYPDKLKQRIQKIAIAEA